MGLAVIGPCEGEKSKNHPFHRDDGKLDRDFQLRVGDMRLLVSQSHRSDESLVLYWAPGKVWSDFEGHQHPPLLWKQDQHTESRLGDHSFPRLLLRFLPGSNGLEHLFLADSSDFRQWN